MSNKEIFSIEIKGIDEMIARLDRIPDEALDVLEKTVKENAHHLIAESKKQCPVDTGRLRGTATVGRVKRKSQEVSVEVGYGTDYAIYVHERKDLDHSTDKHGKPKHGQKAKFLEDPLKENADYYSKRNEAALRDYFANLDKGGGASGS